MGETYIFWRDIMNLFQTVKAAVSPRDAAEAEVEGIFLWAYAGLQRLKQNHFRFTESDRAEKTGKRQSGSTTISSPFWNPTAISG